MRRTALARNVGKTHADIVAKRAKQLRESQNVETDADLIARAKETHPHVATLRQAFDALRMARPDVARFFIKRYSGLGYADAKARQLALQQVALLYPVKH